MRNTRRFTIHDVKARHERAGLFFFTRATLRFFNDRVRDWGVWHVGERVFIRRKRDGQTREFHPDTGEIGTPIPAEEIPAEITRRAS